MRVSTVNGWGCMHARINLGCEYTGTQGVCGVRIARGRLGGFGTPLLSFFFPSAGICEWNGAEGVGILGGEVGSGRREARGEMRLVGGGAWVVR